MCQGVVLRVVGDRPGGVIDRHGRRAVVAAAVLRTQVLIEDEVPAHGALAPVAHVADNQKLVDILEVLGEARAAEAGALAEPDALVRVGVVQCRLGIDGSAVPVERRAGCIRVGGRVTQHVVRILVGPVVIPYQDLGSDPGRGKRRTHVAAEQGRLLARAHAHARVSPGDVERLVLHGDVIDRDPLSCVRLHELDEVVGPGRVVLALKIAADHRAGRLHPSGRAPWVGHDAERRIDGLDLLEQRNDALQIVVDVEVGQVRVGLAGRHVVVAVVTDRREVGRAHRLAQEAQPDTCRRVEQVVEERGLLGRGELAADQRSRGIGQRSPEAIDPLIGCGRIDVDGRWVGAAVRRKCQIGLLLEQLGLVGRGHPDTGGLAGRHRGCGQQRCRQHQYCRDDGRYAQHLGYLPYLNVHVVLHLAQRSWGRVIGLVGAVRLASGRCRIPTGSSPRRCLGPFPSGGHTCRSR